MDVFLPQIVEIRRDIHAHPELGYEEHRTSAKVTDWLQANGLEIERNVAGTGVVGVLRGIHDGRTVALRADMDALPITENSGAPHASKEGGKAHACGHDGHTAILMGTAKLLSMLRSELRGNVKFIFQPAEEGGGGGNRMCKEGVLENPKVDAIFALHSWPDLNVGEVGIRYGVMTAYSDRFELTMIGKGGHAARPERAIDPIVMAAKVVEALQSIVSRRTSPLAPVVITVGKIQGGSAANVIPDSVSMQGTIRTLDEATREKVHTSIREVANAIANMFSAPEPKLDIRKGYPTLVNNDQTTKLTENAAREIVADKVKIIDKPSMGGEDFSYYLQKVPGTLFRLGVFSKENHTASLHTAGFDFNDEAIRTGMLMLTGVVFKFLEHQT